MQSPGEILSQINSFFSGKIRKKSSDSLTSPSPDEDDDNGNDYNDNDDKDDNNSSEEEDSDSSETKTAITSSSSAGKLRRHSDIADCYRRKRKTGLNLKASVSRQSAVNFMRMAKQDIKLNLKRLSFGDNTPPPLPARHFSIDLDEDSLPPPIPERKCSLECFLDVEFERRFTFRPIATCRLPEKFTDCKKTYPSKQPRRKGLQRPVTGPPPPPPPADSSSPSSSPNTSPNALFSLSSPPFKQGIGGAKKGIKHNQNGENVAKINKANRPTSQNGFHDNDNLPLPPPPPNPLMSSKDIRNNDNHATGKYDPNGNGNVTTYSKALKSNPKLDLRKIKQNVNKEQKSASESDVFGELNGSQSNLNSDKLPPSLIPPPPSKPLPPPPLSTKPSLMRVNSNQQITSTSSTQGMRNSVSTPIFSITSASSPSVMRSINGGKETHNENSIGFLTKKTQRSISTPSPPPPLPNRISMSPSLKPKPTTTSKLFENGSGNGIHIKNGGVAHSGQQSDLNQQAAFGYKNKTNKSSPSLGNMRSINESPSDKDSVISSPNSSPSSSASKKSAQQRQSPPQSNAKPLLPPKKESLINMHNHQSSASPSFNQSSLRPPSSFVQPAFSSHPLPPPPPSPTPIENYSSSTTSVLPPPPPPPPQSQPTLPLSPCSSPSSSSLLSSSSSLSNSYPRKLSGNNKNRPLPPPPSEDAFVEVKKTLKTEHDYGDGWGGKEAFDPREEDGDLYDLMDSTNM